MTIFSRTKQLFSGLVSSVFQWTGRAGPDFTPYMYTGHTTVQWVYCREYVIQLVRLSKPQPCHSVIVGSQKNTLGLWCKRRKFPSFIFSVWYSVVYIGTVRVYSTSTVCATCAFAYVSGCFRSISIGVLLHSCYYSLQDRPSAVCSTRNVSVVCIHPPPMYSIHSLPGSNIRVATRTQTHT